MPQINGARIKHEFERLGLNRVQFADEFKIGRKQLGEHLKRSGLFEVNENTAKIYEKAFGVSRAELLKLPPKQNATQLPDGWRQSAVPMRDEDWLTLNLTARRYQTSPLSILRLSAVMFTILAELQLSERRRYVQEGMEQLDAISDSLNHFEDVVVGKGRVYEALHSEDLAIKARDIFGASFDDAEWRPEYEYPRDLFEIFLSRKLAELAPDLYKGSDGNLSHTMYDAHIDELTNGDPLGRMVLVRGDVKLAEILNMGPEERLPFLHRRCSPSTRQAFEREQELLNEIVPHLEELGAK